MLYLIGLGLNVKGMSLEGLEICKKANEIYLEGYTVDFPYSIEELENVIGKKIKKLGREDVESENLVKEARKKEIILLVYGNPLVATTHISLLQMCIEKKIKYKVIHAGSIFDAVAETGLSLYKFGKVMSMPKWTKNYKPDSFLTGILENIEIGAHSLLLIDIGLEFNEALKQLEQTKKFNEIVVCSMMGTEKQKIFYGNTNNLKKEKINPPFCFIIPGKMHFLEQEFLGNYRI